MAQNCRPANTSATIGHSPATMPELSRTCWLKTTFVTTICAIVIIMFMLKISLLSVMAGENNINDESPASPQGGPQRVTELHTAGSEVDRLLDNFKPATAPAAEPRDASPRRNRIVI